MTERLSRRDLVWLPVVLAGLAVIYLPSLDNRLVYDDGYLTSGLFDEYRHLAVRVRMLSYGSFVWLHSLFGDGWWKQRLVNLGIHAAVVLAMWFFYREVLGCVQQAPSAGEAQPPLRRSPALAFAVGFFALNPVAVYAVAYLIQRSILLATFFVVLGLWLFTRALVRREPWLFLAAIACYLLAMLSKENAVLAPLAALPLYVIARRPRASRLSMVALGGGLLVGLAGYALTTRYPNLIGQAFDEYSHVYLAQLGRLQPGADRHAYPLSILNEAWLFFRYGALWFIPWSGWMSINLRPPFPVTWHSFPQVLGVLGYLGVLAGGAVLVLRYRDWRALLGLSLLMPALLFGTEFATVWVQDPFVLYRSYLWAIGVPGIVFVMVHGPSARAMLVAGLVVGALLAWQALDRVFSMHDPVSVWTDAIRKLPDDPRSVGRWFPYLNRGSAFVDEGNLNLAMADFEASAALGDEGMGQFNLGSILVAKGQYAEALAAFDRARKGGYDLYNLPFETGLALQGLGRAPEALAQFEAALARDPPSPTREAVLVNLGRSAMQQGKADEAVSAFEQLVARAPDDRDARYLLAMAYIMKGEARKARTLLDRLVAEQPSVRVHYARALANYRLGQKADALADIDAALRGAPDNPTLRAWREKILSLP